jgi:hypothetical protein
MATVYTTLAPGLALPFGTAFPQFRVTAGTVMPEPGLWYDGSVSQTSHWKLTPTVYGSGSITADVRWYADTATSGGITFEAAIAAITPNADTQDVETDAYATASQASDTHLGTVGQRLHSFTISIATMDSMAAGDRVSFRLTRLPADAGDTMTGFAIVTEVVLSWSDT